MIDSAMDQEVRNRKKKSTGKVNESVSKYSKDGDDLLKKKDSEKLQSIHSQDRRDSVSTNSTGLFCIWHLFVIVIQLIILMLIVNSSVSLVLVNLGHGNLFTCSPQLSRCEPR